MSIQHATCDRCSCDIEYDDADEDDGPRSGPEGSEWEGCSLCEFCHEEAEVNGGDDEDMREPE